MAVSEVLLFSSCENSFSNEPFERMNNEEESNFVSAWIELEKTDRYSPRYKELFWSVCTMDELTHKEPEAAWKIILTILRTDNSSKIQEDLSAGPLEDLLACHGEQMIERIEKEAATNPLFANLLGGVWKNKMTDEVWRRVQACWDRRGWDGIPE